jgi:hypothetical protein
VESNLGSGQRYEMRDEIWSLECGIMYRQMLINEKITNLKKGKKFYSSDCEKSIKEAKIRVGL